MSFDPDRHHRRSIRLRGYDYTTAGSYFITIVAQHRQCLFGEIVAGVMYPNESGQMIDDVWAGIPAHYPGVETDEFVVMPNHIHAIITLVGAAPHGRPGIAMSVADVVQRFKSLTTRRYADGVIQSGWTPFAGRLWQRNYYEHIIRNDTALQRIRAYIATNPTRWAADAANPASPRRNG